MQAIADVKDGQSDSVDHRMNVTKLWEEPPTFHVPGQPL